MFLLEMTFTLLMLILLQAVLGFDNLLYISLESKKAPEQEQQKVRTLGIGIAIFLRIGLLFALFFVIPYLEAPLFTIGNPVLHHAEKKHDSEQADKTALDDKKEASSEDNHNEHSADDHSKDQEAKPANWLDVAPSIHAIIVLLGGAFIIYTAIKEIFHMLKIEHDDLEKGEKKSSNEVIFWIVLMNLVFSFDSILSAMALTDNLIVMTLAIIASGVLMIVMADTVSKFLHKNRMYEVLGLFILFVVGIMLVTEGGHKAGLAFWGNEIVPMSKTTFYFVIAVMVLTDIVQSQYQKKLLAETDKLHASH